MPLPQSLKGFLIFFLIPTPILLLTEDLLPASSPWVGNLTWEGNFCSGNLNFLGWQRPWKVSSIVSGLLSIPECTGLWFPALVLILKVESQGEPAILSGASLNHRSRGLLPPGRWPRTAEREL